MAQSRIAEAYVQLVPSLDGFGKAIQSELSKELGSSLDSSVTQGAEASGSKAGGLLNKGISKGLKAAAIGVAAGAAIAGGIVAGLATKALRGGIDRALNIDDAQAKLKGLGYEGEQIQGITDNVLDAVRGTSYALDETMGLAGTALAAGVSEGQELTDYLKTITDVATITGGSVGEIGDILGKTQASGKAMTNELQQLQSRGLPVFQWLQEELGVETPEAMQQMVSAGEVSSQQLLDTINANIGGAAAASGETVRGAMANFNAALSRTGAAVVAGGMPVFLELINKATPLVDALTDRLGPLADSFWEMFGPKLLEGAETFFNFILGIIEGTNEASGGFGEMFSSLAPLAEMASILSPLGIIFRTLAELAPDLIKAFQPIGELVIETLIPAFVDILAALLPVVTTVIELAAGLIAALLPSLIGLIEVLAPVLTMLIEFLAPALVGIADILGVILPPLVEFLGAMLVGAIEVVALALYGILSFAAWAINGFIDVANTFGAGWNRIQEPQLPNITMFGEGGTIQPRPGGTLGILAEAGRAETVTDLGKTNQLIDNSNRLAHIAMSGGAGSQGPQGNITFEIHQQPGESTEELVQRIEEYFALNSLRAPGYIG